MRNCAAVPPSQGIERKRAAVGIIRIHVSRGINPNRQTEEE
jgi:hypothetical protein